MADAETVVGLMDVGRVLMVGMAIWGGVDVNQSAEKPLVVNSLLLSVCIVGLVGGILTENPETMEFWTVMATMWMCGYLAAGGADASGGRWV